MRSVDEGAGISLWRQICEIITDDIAQGRFRANERLPSSKELAQRFSVNRHTIHKAIQHLQAEGVLRIERARGAYAVVNSREFRIGPRRRFEQNLLEPSVSNPRKRKIISVQVSRAAGDTAKLLGLHARENVLCVKTIGEIDDLPVIISENHFLLKNVSDVEESFRNIQNEAPEHFSFTEILWSFGIKTWRRKSIHIQSRMPRREETIHLKLSSNDPVLITTSIHTDAFEVPFWYNYSVYSSSRSTLVVDL